MKNIQHLWPCFIPITPSILWKDDPPQRASLQQAPCSHPASPPPGHQGARWPMSWSFCFLSFQGHIPSSSRRLGHSEIKSLGASLLFNLSYCLFIPGAGQGLPDHGRCPQLSESLFWEAHLPQNFNRHLLHCPFISLLIPLWCVCCFTANLPDFHLLCVKQVSDNHFGSLNYL